MPQITKLKTALKHLTRAVAPMDSEPSVHEPAAELLADLGFTLVPFTPTPGMRDLVTLER